MDKKMELYNTMSKKRYELDDKRSELEQSTDRYREQLVNETIDDILNILKEEGNITKRDLKLFLGNLALQTKQMYTR